jgi:uncharacterized membrane protein YjjB (DUF3815 family)
MPATFKLTICIRRALFLLSQKYHSSAQELRAMGKIPETVGLLSNLQSINLKGNALSGTIPASLFQLPNITEVYVMSVVVELRRVAHDCARLLERCMTINLRDLSQTQFNTQLGLLI